MSHYVEKCRVHNVVVGQCRCPATDKPIRWVDCRCKETPAELPPPDPATKLVWKTPSPFSGYFRVVDARDGIASFTLSTSQHHPLFPVGPANRHHVDHATGGFYG